MRVRVCSAKAGDVKVYFFEVSSDNGWGKQEIAFVRSVPMCHFPNKGSRLPGDSIHGRRPTHLRLRLDLAGCVDRVRVQEE